MKKLFVAILSALMVFTLVGCQSGTADGVYTYIYEADIDSLNYLITNKHTDNQHFANFIDGLYENDPTGAFVPALAESYTKNDDSTKWTFKIRQGVKWVTSTGDEYAEVTAKDWVTAIKYQADKKSSLLDQVPTYIANIKEYQSGKVDFDKVGVKALDDYTLEFTLSKPVPYFLSMTTYSVLLPLNEEFLKSKGDAFGSVDPQSILYNGPFILSINDAKSKIQYTKNLNYWDVKNVHLSEVNFLFDDGSDTYSVIKGFENGSYVAAGISASWENFKDYVEKYKDNITVTSVNSSSFGLNLNFNRKAHAYTNKDEAALEATKNAIQNENFRKAFTAAFDRSKYMQQNMPEEIANVSMRNMINYPEIVKTSDGTSYQKLVEAAYKELSGTEIDLSDSGNPFFGKDKALAFIEKAKADGVQFPVTIDYPYISNTAEIWVKRANSLKSSIEENSDKNIIINLVPITQDEYLKHTYLFESTSQADYDLNTNAGWAPDYVDPKSSAEIYNNIDGASLKNIGLEYKGTNAEDDAIAEKTGIAEYTRLLQEADKETSNLDERYKKYAKAEAYLLEKAFYSPFQQQIRGYRVTKIVPFSGSFAITGLGADRLKYTQIQKDLVTVDQYNKAKEAWLEARNKAN